MELGDAVASYRFHNQGVPNVTRYYQGFPAPSAVVEKLQSIGHHVQKYTSFCVTQAVSRKGNFVYGMSDPRKSAEADGY